MFKKNFFFEFFNYNKNLIKIFNCFFINKKIKNKKFLMNI